MACCYCGRVKLPPTLAVLLRSQLETAVKETAFNDADALIAELCLVKKTAQEDIAAELGWERSTVSRRLPSIVAAVEKTAATLYRQ